ncbi:MAG: hypothetical protein QME52_04740 [Bacteroidota bacterium]|nr:hypothetical protein [Bacteroidota bacterium]
MKQSCFVYRQAGSIEEFRELLFIRSLASPENRFAKTETTKEVHLNIDSYDSRSFHFGLYKVLDEESAPVGYIRIVGDMGRGPLFREVEELIDDHPTALAKSFDVVSTPFPMMRYFPGALVVGAFYRKIKEGGQALVEASQHLLVQQVESASLSQFMVSAMLATALVHCVDVVIIICVPRLKTFYNQFGFSSLPGTYEHYCPMFDKSVVCIFGTQKSLPIEMVDQIHSMAEVFEATGCICFNPTQPNNFYPTEEYLQNQNLLAEVAARMLVLERMQNNQKNLSLRISKRHGNAVAKDSRVGSLHGEDMTKQSTPAVFQIIQNKSYDNINNY